MLPLVVAALLAAGPTGGADPLDACRAVVRERPRDLEAWRCFWRVARTTGRAEEAARALRGALDVDPRNARARLYLAAIEADRDPGRAVPLYAEAADGLERLGDRTGEVYARVALAHLLGRQGRTVEADLQLDRAEAAAEAASEPMLLARVRLGQANRAGLDADWGLSRSLLEEAEALAFPDGPSDLRSAILLGIGRACWAQGRFRSALEVYARDAALHAGIGDRVAEATARYNIAATAARLAEEGQLDRDTFLRLAREAAGAAASAGNPRAEAGARLLLLPHEDPARAVPECEGILAAALRRGDVPTARTATRLLAAALARLDPPRRAEAEARIDEAIREARAAGDPEEVARTESARAAILDRDPDPLRRSEAWDRALAAAEEVRRRQPEGGVRSRVASEWAFVSYRAADRRLREGDVDGALRVLERMRARVLLEEWACAGIAPAADEPLAAVREEIARAQREGADPAVLDSLEEQEEVLRDRAARTLPFRPAGEPPGLEEIRAVLEPDEALLVYLVPPDPAEAWAVLVTPEEARAHSLEAGGLDAAVHVYLGLVRDGHPGERRAAAALDHVLLEPLRPDLPPGAGRRLVIVPDGPLHDLPFAALLGGDVEFTIAPSLAFWVHARSDPRALPPGVVALADPLVGGVPSPFRGGSAPGPLPAARREARELARRLPGPSRVRVGAEASEAWLKGADLSGSGILLLAAHAVDDDERPERSAVLLAPGSDREDGLIQARDLGRLDLSGRVVLLTACSSASGTPLRGEGLVGLARAFQHAGARAVVGSVLPLQDAESASMMETFARALGRGARLAEALAEARRERVRAGAPVAAWAGLVVLGDGDLVPVPGGTPWPPWAGVLALAGLAVGLAWAVRRAWRGAAVG